MRKTILLLMLLGIFLVLGSGDAEAGHYSYGHGCDNSVSPYDCNFYSHYGPAYRRYVPPRYQAYDYLITSHFWRYDIAYGRDSGDVFYYDNYYTEGKPSNWRYKEAFVPSCRYNDCSGGYYYEPRRDYQSGTWNWRY